MKKVIVLCTLIGFLVIGSNLLADPPVCPPFEGFYIETITEVSVFGNLEESEDFEWTWNNDHCMGTTRGIQDNDIEPNESVARITYSEEFDSFNGLSGGVDSENYSRGEPISEDPPTTLDKTFSVDTHLIDADHNVDVEKSIGYQSDGQAGSQADLREVGSLEIVSAGGFFARGDMFAGVLALCPWAVQAPAAGWPATNEGIAMGSRFHVPSQLANGDPGYITFTSNGHIDGTTGPVGMHYDVTADGKGVMEAEMIARLWEGSSQGTQATVPALNSRATYEEYVQASGIFPVFHKSMTYRAQFAAPSVTPTNTNILE